MEHSRLAQQRALRQLFQSRIALQRQTFRQNNHSSQQPFPTRPLTRCFQTSRTTHRPSSRISQFVNKASKSYRRFQSTQAPPQPTENLSLSQRLKKLSREYGWSALGVYLLLTLLDFPFCFLAVRSLGVERIGHWEHAILSQLKGWVKWPLSAEYQDAVDGAIDGVKKRIPIEELRGGEKRLLEEEETYVVEDHGVKEAEKANAGGNASTCRLFSFSTSTRCFPY